MGSPILIAYDPGERFSSINTLAVGGGISWGTCLLSYRNLDFSRHTLDGAGFYVGCNTDEEIFFRYCHIELDKRHLIYLPRNRVTKLVAGISIGMSYGGILDIFDSVAKTVFWNVFRHFISNTIGGVAGLADLTVGTTTSIIDSGVFHGINGNDNFSLNINNFSTYEYCLVRFSAGALLGVAVNILLLGNFRKFTHYTLNEHKMPDNSWLIRYLYDVIAFSQCFVIIGEASAGLILPGGSANIVAT